MMPTLRMPRERQKSEDSCFTVLSLVNRALLQNYLAIFVFSGDGGKKYLLLCRLMNSCDEDYSQDQGRSLYGTCPHALCLDIQQLTKYE